MLPTFLELRHNFFLRCNPHNEKFSNGFMFPIVWAPKLSKYVDFDISNSWSISGQNNMNCKCVQNVPNVGYFYLKFQ